MSPQRAPRLPPETPTAHANRLLLALGLWGALHLLATLSARPPAPLGEDAPTQVFSAGRAAVVLQELARDLGPHPSGTPAAALVRQRIVEHLTRLRYEPQVQEVFSSGPRSSTGTVRNVIARRPGRVAAESAVLLVAHYDSVGAGPGVGDDLSGVATLLEIARVVRQSSPRRRVIFLITDAEEHGMVGAAGFAQSHPWMEDVGVVLNLEARGVSGPSHMFETGADNGWLIDLYAESVQDPSANSCSVEIYRRMPNDTDFSVFRDRGLPGMNFAFIDGVYAYHTSVDDLEHISLASLQHQGEQVLACLRALDDRRVLPTRGDAVYTSVLGSVLLHHPAQFAPWLALLAAAGILWATHRSVRHGRTGWGRLGVGIVFAPFFALAPVALCVGLAAAMRAGTGEWSPWHASPSPTMIAVLGAILCSWCVLAPLGSRLAGSVGATQGAWIWWGMGALFLGLFVPGASYLLTFPALVLAFLGNAVRLSDSVEARLGRVALWALGLAVLIWSPVQAGLASAFGLDQNVTITVPLACLGTLLLPLLVHAPRAVRRGLGGVGLACVAFGSVMVFVLPARSSERPGRLNLVYAQQGGEAEWQAWTYGAPLPAELEAVLPLDSGPRRIRQSWSGSDCYRADAPFLGLPEPRFEVLSDGVDEDGRRHVIGVLMSPLRAQRTDLVISSPWPVEVLRAEGADLPALQWARFLAIPEEGLTLELILAPPDPAALARREYLREQGVQLPALPPLTLHMVDRRYELPDEGSHLAQARPISFVPQGAGDGVLIAARRVLGAR